MMEKVGSVSCIVVKLFNHGSCIDHLGLDICSDEYK